ncbi:hypothetical protein PENTCL1PPCAC_10510, partial [Pristionchus entomophagus]
LRNMETNRENDYDEAPSTCCIANPSARCQAGMIVSLILWSALTGVVTVLIGTSESPSWWIVIICSGVMFALAISTAIVMASRQMMRQHKRSRSVA